MKTSVLDEELILKKTAQRKTPKNCLSDHVPTWERWEEKVKQEEKSETAPSKEELS